MSLSVYTLAAGNLSWPGAKWRTYLSVCNPVSTTRIVIISRQRNYSRLGPLSSIYDERVVSIMPASGFVGIPFQRSLFLRLLRWEIVNISEGTLAHRFLFQIRDYLCGQMSLCVKSLRTQFDKS